MRKDGIQTRKRKPKKNTTNSVDGLTLGGKKDESNDGNITFFVTI